jgi:hypothetical protein
MTQAQLEKHPQDLQKACIGFIASLKEPASSHAIYGQTAVNKGTGAIQQSIVIHRHPVNARLEFRERILPRSFAGFPIVELPWPNQDL